MTADELSAPLGQGKARVRRALPWRPLIAGIMALPIAVFAGWAMLNSDPFGGEPLAVAPVSVETAAGEADAPPAPAPAGPPSAPNPNNTKTVTIIDGTSGTRREVVIPGAPDSPPASAEQRLSEPSRHGPLPRIAPDGTRPSEAFARPVNVPAGRANAPRIALVVAGLGISATATADALRKLPGPVTLAFAPYGGDLEHQVARARESGHEVMLQVPMEPLDFPDNDPGPHTLLTSLDAAQNIDRLHWLMSRFQGYVGIVNAMGGRFSASEQAMSSVLREAATRGLLFLDDGSSPRSLASQIAGANNIAFAKADLILDQVPTPAEIDRALGRIETIARTRGTAVAIAGALPVSIDRIARFVKAVESRGILLVPITAAVARARPS